jgi:hypothetical protein
MSRKLAIVTGSGLVLCAAFLGLAVLIGGDDIFHDARSLERVKPLVDLATHKAWQWNGGDTLALDAPINIRYRPSGPPRVSVTGPAELLQHVQVGDGRIGSDTRVAHNGGKRLDAVISGVPIRKFVVNGTENLDLGEIDQPGLDLHINGTGVVRGRGKVERLNLSISGPGNADLGGLAVTGDAKVSILGSGDAMLSPHGKVKLFIAGSGRLRLLTHPADLRQTIVGSGQVEQLTGEAAQAALKALDVSRVATDAASNAIEATLGKDGIGRIAAEAARAGIESAQIDRHVREGVARGLSQADMQDPRNGTVFVRGNRDSDLGHVDQKSLKITIVDSGSVIAEGKVDDLSVSILGSGHARLGKLAARNVSVEVMGSGNATVAPSDELKATIMGSGDVRLLTRPAKIQRMIMGSGRIIEERQIIEERRIIEEHR